MKLVPGLQVCLYILKYTLVIEQQDEQQHADERPGVHPQSFQRQGEGAGHCGHKGKNYFALKLLGLWKKYTLLV